MSGDPGASDVFEWTLAKRISLAETNEIINMEASAIQQNAGTTVFTNDSGEVTGVPHLDVEAPRNKLKPATSRPQEIVDFFSKPIATLAGVYSTSTTARTIIASKTVASMLTYDMWVSKFRGNLNMRGTIVLRLQINSMPFQSGLLMLKFIPPCNANLYSMRTNSPITFSQLPGVTMSLKQGEAIIKFPYRSPTYYYDLLGIINSPIDWGTVIVYAYTSLRTAATSVADCDWTLWASWEDVEIETPTMPQSGGGPSVRDKRGIRLLKGKIIQDKEVNGGKGPISSILSGGASIARGLGFIPTLGPLMGSAQWFLNRAAGVASSFGWSKPIISDGPMRMINNAHAYGNNADGSETALSLGLSSENSIVPITDIGLTDQDEMSINFIKTRWSFIQANTWNTSQTPYTALYTAQIYPRFFAGSGTATSLNHVVSYYIPTPISFLSNLFRFWRGSIRMRIRISKTDFHSGRLMVVYTPGRVSLNANIDYPYREIIDLRDGDSFCLTLPYASAWPWLDTNTPTGFVSIQVLNPLRAASSVDTTVDIITEISGGDDLEFAVPSHDQLYPFLPQMDCSIENEVRCGMIGGADEPREDNETEITIGEDVSSLAQLCKQYSRLFVSGSTSSTPTVANGSIDPYYIGGLRVVNAATNLQISCIYGDYLSLIVPLYAFWRGGVKVKMITDRNDGHQLVSLLVPSTLSSPTVGSPGTDPHSGGLPGPTPGTSSYGSCYAPAAFMSSTNGGFAVRVPPYQPGRYRTVQWSASPTDSQVSTDKTPMHLHWSSVGVSPDSTSIMLRGASDDFQCGLFLCVPPVTISMT